MWRDGLGPAIGPTAKTRPRKHPSQRNSSVGNLEYDDPVYVMSQDTSSNRVPWSGRASLQETAPWMRPEGSHADFAPHHHLPLWLLYDYETTFKNNNILRESTFNTENAFP